MRSGVCHAAKRLQRAAGSVEAFHFCRAERWPIVEAPTHLEPVPGLYAIHAAEEAWSELGLEHRRDVPLYVGMSRSSLVTRELGQNFAIDPEVPARTGGSTVRRSFAALLREPLQLRGVPRNLDRPERPANYGLDQESDARLTSWMHRILTLAVWPMPAELPLSQLEPLETDVIAHGQSVGGA